MNIAGDHWNIDDIKAYSIELVELSASEGTIQYIKHYWPNMVLGRLSQSITAGSPTDFQWDSRIYTG